MKDNVKNQHVYEVVQGIAVPHRLRECHSKCFVLLPSISHRLYHLFQSLAQKFFSQISHPVIEQCFPCPLHYNLFRNTGIKDNHTHSRRLKAENGHNPSSIGGETIPSVCRQRFGILQSRGTMKACGAASHFAI